MCLDEIKMRHVVAICLLIATVVACPQMCLSELTSAGLTSAGLTSAGVATWNTTGSQSSCGCCESKSEPLGNRETDNQPEQQDSCCLCQGAIVSLAPVRQRSPFDCLLPMSVADHGLNSLGRSSQREHSIASQQFPAISTGRQLCALMCAYLL